MKEHDIDDRDLGGPDPAEIDAATVEPGACPDCRGSGATLSGDTCPLCQGTGRPNGRVGGG